jgi:replication factor C subunit 2/4
MNKDFTSWVEKYRPSKLNEITAQTDVIKSLKKVLETKNLPHLLFFGPSGCGKTSTILALSKELFGEKLYNDRVIELNASDERGINIVREKIKTYAKKSINPTADIPPWKIIILDEADNMTSDSQFALRRIMEEYSKITRFCIICNYHNKIIDPINSRCALFRFKPIKQEDIIIKLKDICVKENLTLSDEFLNQVITFSRGDLRKAINFLQKCQNRVGSILNQDILNEISGIIPQDIFNILINGIINKNSLIIDKQITEIINNGYSLVNQIVLFDSFIKKNTNFPSCIKAELSLKLTEIDNHLLKGGGCADRGRGHRSRHDPLRAHLPDQARRVREVLRPRPGPRTSGEHRRSGRRHRRAVDR